MPVVPAIAVIMGALFTKLFDLFFVYMGKRVALGFAFLASMVLITGTFILAMNGLASFIKVSAPQQYTQYFGYMMPDNYATFIGVALSARLTQWGYFFKVHVMSTQFRQMSLF